MLGILPAAGSASRMQPLGGSKELLPLGWCASADPATRGRVRAVSEYVIERMLHAGADRICWVVSSEKADLLRFYAQADYASRLFFVVQPQPTGLCDAVFRARRFVGPNEAVLIGLPDTVWYPRAAFRLALRNRVHLITFPVANPAEFDAVVPGEGERVASIEVKGCHHGRHRVWGAMTAPGHQFLALERMWRDRNSRDTYLGELLNAWIGAGHPVSFDRQGTQYWDIGTPAGYEQALRERIWEQEVPQESTLAAEAGWVESPRVHLG